MRVVTRSELEARFSDHQARIEDGAVFIHPTDTIYGLGCDAMNADAVKKIRDAKQRSQNPFSVIAPSKQWISENCEVSPEAKKWIDEQLPGPYTLILRLKNPDCIAHNVNFGKDTLGVRIPAHWISDLVGRLGFPCVTTSANKSGERFMTSQEDLDAEVAAHVDFFISEGGKKGRPSTLVDLTGPMPVLQRR